MTAWHVYWGPDADTARPTVRKVGVADAFAALKQGFDDFLAMPTHLAFLALFYVVAGGVLAGLSSFGGALQLVFPLASGFALIGPFAALGLYELSRRRELGLQARVTDAFVVFNSPALPSIAVLGLGLALIFGAWIAVAQNLYVSLYGADAPASARDFLNDVLTTSRGMRLIVVGGAIGFVFALVTLCVSIVSFPLMLDRDTGLVPAVAASLRLCRESPLAVAAWGAIVAALLILGALPLFIGLAVALPVLGHGSWAFYRRAIQRDPAHEHPAHWPRVDTPPPSYLARPHSVLFPPPRPKAE